MQPLLVLYEYCDVFFPPTTSYCATSPGSSTTVLQPPLPAPLHPAQLLRSLPPEQGVQLEFWRTVPMMYGMAQQYAMLEEHPAALQVRAQALGPRLGREARREGGWQQR